MKTWNDDKIVLKFLMWIVFQLLEVLFIFYDKLYKQKCDICSLGQRTIWCIRQPVYCKTPVTECGIFSVGCSGGISNSNNKKMEEKETHNEIDTLWHYKAWHIATTVTLFALYGKYSIMGSMVFCKRLVPCFVGKFKSAFGYGIIQNIICGI